MANNSPVAAADHWKKRVLRNSDGVIYAHELNVMTVLEHADEFKAALVYDAFADQIRVRRPLPWDLDASQPEWMQEEHVERTWADTDRIELQRWLQAHALRVMRGNVVQDAVIATAHRLKRHPVRDYLRHCWREWDQQPRIEGWLRKYLSAKDAPAYLQQIGPKFLVGAVARIMNDSERGVQMDTMLILEGAQGLGKSSVVRVMSNGWCTDVANELHNKDAAIGIQGIWIGEFGELTALARTQIEATKAFISRIVDKYRPPYGRNAIERPRQCVFIATTNEYEYLQDQTGNRRFWPVDCAHIDLEALAADREQLWGEAFDWWKRGVRHYLDKPAELLARREQQLRRRISPLEVEVLEYVDRIRSQNVVRVDMRTVLTQALGLQTTQIGPQLGALARDVSRVLTANGWIRHRPRGRAANRVVMYEYAADRDPLSSDEKTEDVNHAPVNMLTS